MLDVFSLRNAAQYQYRLNLRFNPGFLKYEMDLWFGNHPKNERECQQLMLWENNIGNSAKSTDYFICDMAGNSGSFRVLLGGEMRQGREL